MNKHDLIQKVKALDGISQDERAYLIDLINTKKKYGLVWEDKPEDVEETLRTHLPVLQEVPEKRITGCRDLQDRQDKNAVQDLRMGKNRQDSKKSSLLTLFDKVSEQDLSQNQSNNPVVPDNPLNPVKDCFPNHTLIEGDNLHALTALTFTHEGRIDVIYIDPPYNTGNKDFKYNDSFVDREDSYRHSKWLSFMDKRLRIAKRLLSDKGVIFISIDDNEQAQLKMLCDEVFGEGNFVGNVIWKNVTDNNPTNIAVEHEYIYCYARQKSLIDKFWKSSRSHAKEVLLEIEKKLLEQYENTIFLEAEYKLWFKENKKFLGELDRYKYIDRGGIYTGSQSVHNPGKEGYRYDIIHPISHKPCKQPLMGYRFPESSMVKLIEEGKILFGEDHNKLVEIKVYAKDYLSKFSSLIELDGRLGANELREIFHESTKVFNNPKPVTLVSDILSFSSNTDSTILDFFAGSGTTLHATMALNAEDGGSRQCILVTNNENNICEEVTYERNKRVIEGYYKGNSLPTGEGRGGVFVPGLSGNNLRYYRTATVEREPSLRNKRQLTRLATELLCIKEDCYTPRATTDTALQAFEEQNKRLLLVYDDAMIDEALEYLKTWLSETTIESPIKVYVFSNGQYPYTEDFEEVLPHITLCALPDAIYKAYQHVLPKRERKNMMVLEEETSESLPE